ncbi:MAG: hypothetical protein HY390_03225 [Deltaproteobacteria bacterium]|nr:hypothetical protein [Deltaproteobacteria bacterium]
MRKSFLFEQKIYYFFLLYCCVNFLTFCGGKRQIDPQEISQSSTRQNSENTPSDDGLDSSPHSVILEQSQTSDPLASISSFFPFHYLKITEKNTDALTFPLEFGELPSPPPLSFELKNHQLHLYIRDGKPMPWKLDGSEPLLFVEYTISFVGEETRGRVGEVSSFFILTQSENRIPTHSFGMNKQKLFLDLYTPLQALFEIRYPPDEFELAFDVKGVRYKNQILSPGYQYQSKGLKIEKTVLIEKEVPKRIKIEKGMENLADLASSVEVLSFGEVVFKTNILLKYMGSYDQVQKH